MNHTQKNELISEFENNKANTLEAIYDLSNYLSLDKFKDTDSQMNNYVQVSDVQLRLNLIIQALLN